ncbi:MAG TPA: COX15/CtaA family protein [Acidobacteriaceae bacterium]
MSTELRRPRKALRWLAWVALAWNVLVILWGAMVRATGSGAGCGNHWPLCNGQVIPTSPRIATIIEFTHRCMTGGATLLVLAVLIGVFLATDKGHRARIAAVVTTLLLVNEALLGAVLVKLGYVTTNRSLGRVVALSIHLSNTLLLMAALTVTAILLERGVARPRVTAGKATRWWVSGGLIATIVVGVSGSLAALGDTLFPSATLAQAMAQDFATNAPLLLRLRWVHPAAACVATIFVAWILAAGLRRGFRGGALVVAALLAIQFALGVADVLLLAPVWMQILHLLGADLYWIALVLLSYSILIGPCTSADSASNATGE